MKFVFAHKDIEVPEGYTLIDTRANKELDHRLYSEVAGIDLLVKKLKKAEKQKADDKTGKTNQDFPPIWIQLNHYRRYMDIDCNNRTYVASPMIFPYSVAQQYASLHFIEDFKQMFEALKLLYPSMVQFAERVVNENIFIPYNICNIQYSQFMDYSKFLLDVLKKTHELNGNHTYEETLEIMKRREIPKVEGRNNEPEYQARYLSFLSERLSTVYFRYISQQIPVYPAKINLLEKDQKI